MDELINKKYLSHDYLCRYDTNPVYYNFKTKKWVMGIGTNIKNDSSYIIHQVKPNDTLDKLALKYYNNPTYWWYIANFNRILDPNIQLSDHFKNIKIPHISDVTFGAER